MGEQPPDQMPTGPPSGPIGNLARSLGVLSQLYQSRMSVVLEPTGLTYNQVALLSHLAALGEPQSISAIAEALEINQPGVTKIVKKMVEAGFLSTTDSEHDRRLKLVSVTPDGYRHFGHSIATIAPDVASWFDTWTEDDIATFDRLLSDLIGHLDHHRLG